MGSQFTTYILWNTAKRDLLDPPQQVCKNPKKHLPRTSLTVPARVFAMLRGRITRATAMMSSMERFPLCLTIQTNIINEIYSSD